MSLFSQTCYLITTCWNNDLRFYLSDLHLSVAGTKSCLDTLPMILGKWLVHSDFLHLFCFGTFTFYPQPPMSDARKRVIGEAFNKLDKSGDGFITIDDVRGVYDVKVDNLRKLIFCHKMTDLDEWLDIPNLFELNLTAISHYSLLLLLQSY